MKRWKALEQPGDRREFFKASARYALLATIAAFSAVGIRNAHRSPEHCVNKGICGSCAVLSTCGLPTALSVRKAKERQ